MRFHAFKIHNNEWNQIVGVVPKINAFKRAYIKYDKGQRLLSLGPLSYEIVGHGGC